MRRHVQDLRTKQTAAVLAMQKCRRRGCARRRLVGISGWLKTSKWLRAIRFALRIKLVVDRKRNAVIKLQRTFRLHRNNEAVRTFTAESTKAARIMQNAARGKLARRHAQMRKEAIVRIQRLFRRTIAMRRLKKLLAEYKTITSDCCQIQHEVIRLLSVLPELTKDMCAQAVERYHLTLIFMKQKMVIRLAYLYASICGQLQVDKFFKVSNAQMRLFLKDVGLLRETESLTRANSSSEISDTNNDPLKFVGLSRVDADMCLLRGIQWTTFHRFDTGATVHPAAVAAHQPKESKGSYDMDAFVEVLVQASAKLYPAVTLYSDKFDMLISEHIKPFVESFQGSGNGVVAFSKLASGVSSNEGLGAQIVAVLKAKSMLDMGNKKEIREIFKVVAGADNLVNAREYFRLMKNTRMADTSLTWSMLLATFVNCTPNLYELLQDMFKIEDLETHFQMNQAQFFLALATSAMLKYKDYKKFKSPESKVAKMIEEIYSKLNVMKSK